MNANAVTISPKYQVVIPKEIRDLMHFHPGQKLQAIPFGNGIMYMLVISVQEAQGLLKGIVLDNDGQAEDDQDRI